MPAEGLGQVAATRGETSRAVELLEQALASDHHLPESDASVAANAYAMTATTAAFSARCRGFTLSKVSAAVW